MRNLTGTELKRLHRDWRRRTPGRLSVVLDGVQGPFNVGAIVRTAAAYRAERMWLAGESPPLDSVKVQKTALGCHRYVAWESVPTAADAAAAAKADGYRVVGVELAEGAVPFPELDLGDADVCLAIGHEDRGLSRGAMEACDDLAYLPQLGRVGSLNVATAAALAIYEVRRRHW